MPKRSYVTPEVTELERVDQVYASIPDPHRPDVPQNGRIELASSWEDVVEALELEEYHELASRLRGAIGQILSRPGRGVGPY